MYIWKEIWNLFLIFSNFAPYVYLFHLCSFLDYRNIAENFVVCNSCDEYIYKSVQGKFEKYFGFKLQIP